MSYSTQIECQVMFVRQNAQQQGKRNRITLQQIISPDFMSLEDRALWCSAVHAPVLEDDNKRTNLSSQIFTMKKTHLINNKTYTV